MGGSGTPGDPFRIEGWKIDSTSFTPIEVRNTTSHVIIRNISTAASYPCGCHDSIFLLNVQNAVVLDSTFLYAYRGVFAEASRNLTVAGISVESSQRGVMIVHSRQVSFKSSRIHNTLEGIWLNNVADGQIANNTLSGDPGGGPSTIIVEYSTDVAIHHNNVIVVPGGVPTHNGLNNTRVRWDDGYPNGGNNWSNYRGWDDCSGPSQDVCTASDGLGDFPHDIYGPEPTVDRYPLVAVNPSNQLPVAGLWYGSNHILRDVPVTFDASSSYDPDGWPLRFDWDLGDGTMVTNGSSIVTHTYTSVATLLLNLTATDVRRGASTVTYSFRVTLEPIVVFAFEPRRPIAGEPIRFSASGSVSRDGELTFAWFFQDGGTAQGVNVTHVFPTHGAFWVELWAQTPYGTWPVSQTVDVGPAWIPLAVYDSPAGFRLPVPTNYSIEQDQVYEGVTIELFLLGPTSGSVRTNIIIDTDLDESVEETNEYLRRTVHLTVQEASRTTGHPVGITEGPTYRTISGHAAVVFRMQYGTASLWQRAAIVVSEAHQRFWVLILTVDAGAYEYVNEAFERMLEGFEITLPAPPIAPGILRVATGGAVAAVLVLIILFAVLRRKPAQPRFPVIQATPVARMEGDREPMQLRFCPNCGTQTLPGNRFCSQCGTRFDRVGQ